MRQWVVENFEGTGWAQIGSSKKPIHLVIIGPAVRNEADDGWEDPAWLHLVDVPDSDTGELYKALVVDQSKKTQLLADRAQDKSAQDKTNSVVDKYDEMSTEVYAKMEGIFYTKKSDSAIANYEMWKHMQKNPGLYSSQGLKAESQLDNLDGSELYSPGSALDTDAKMTAYADRKLEQADEYVVWRSNRIQQFRNEKETIINS